MAVITYKTYHFQEPALIDMNKYLQLKQVIATQSHFLIYRPQESFTGQFKRSLRLFPIVFLIFAIVVGFMLYHGVPEKPLPGWWMALIVVLFASGFISVLLLGQLLLEGPSYAIYLHNKQLYYTAMQYAIGKSNDYTEFKTSFFGPSAKRTADYKLLALTAPSIPQPPGAANRFFIRLFRIIAALKWVFVVALLSWWLWKYFSNK
jgi:hypothetical protein